jgi:hypothetical protein
MHNWNEFKTKYKQEIRVGIVVLITSIAISMLKDILKS